MSSYVTSEVYNEMNNHKIGMYYSIREGGGNEFPIACFVMQKRVLT